MNWASWSDFVAMGGYGLYVWGSFGMTAAILVAEVLMLRSRRAALARMDRHGIDADFEEGLHETQN